MGFNTPSIVQLGSGPPLVLVPGIQGRWQYVRQTMEALARSFRVITFPLAGEQSARETFDVAKGFDNYVDQIADALDRSDVERTVLCGISFGGLAALRFAANHPDRTKALVLASTPGPTWHLRPRHERYARRPYVFGPLFVLESPFRLRQEIKAAFPDRRDALRFARTQLKTLFEAPLSFKTMAARALMIGTADHGTYAARISVPTLVVTGEPTLDHVVPVEGSADYARLIAKAERAVITGTGHLGTITKPDEFASIVRAFVARHEHGGETTRSACSEVA